MSSTAGSVCVVKALKNRGKNTPGQTPVLATMAPTPPCRRRLKTDPLAAIEN